jgi:hypothetical protein
MDIQPYTALYSSIKGNGFADACVVLPHFEAYFYIVGSKIPKTTGIFDGVDHPKSREVTYWAERIGPLVDHISQVSCCTAFGATCYSLNISRLAACI